MKIKAYTWIPVLSLFALIVSLIWYYGFTMLLSTIVDQFVSLARILPFVFLAFSALVIFFVLFFHYFLSPIPKTRLLIYASLSAIFTILGFIFGLLSSHYLFASDLWSKKLIFLLEVIFACCGSFFLFFLALKKKPKEILLPTLRIPLGHTIVDCILFLFVSYYLVDGIRAFVRFEEYHVEPVAYPFFVLLLFALSYFYVLTLLPHSSSKLPFLLYAFSSFIALAFAAGAFSLLFTQAYVNVAQNIFYIDFAASVPIGPISWLVLLLYFTVDLFLEAMKIQKKPIGKEQKQ